MTDAFEGAAPPPPQADRPKLRNLRGRLLLIKPSRIERGVPGPDNDGKLQDRVTANVTILDGGRLGFGDDPRMGVPASKWIEENELPYTIEDMYISGKLLVLQLTVKEEGGRLRVQVLGRLGAKPSAKATYSPAWLLDTPSAADIEIGKAFLNTVNPFG